MVNCGLFFFQKVATKLAEKMLKRSRILKTKLIILIAVVLVILIVGMMGIVVKLIVEWREMDQENGGVLEGGVMGLEELLREEEEMKGIMINFQRRREIYNYV